MCIEGQELHTPSAEPATIDDAQGGPVCICCGIAD